MVDELSVGAGSSNFPVPKAVTIHDDDLIDGE
jgi:hypothetical protein